MTEKHITLPLTEELARSLHAGDRVYLTGTIYTSRDAGHKRMCEALSRGEKLPFCPEDATIYYVGPTPAKPGQVIGSAGPTTSGRMDAYAPTLMSVGARGMIGNGGDEDLWRCLFWSHRRCRSAVGKMHPKMRTDRLRGSGSGSSAKALCGGNAPGGDHRQ